MKMLSIPPVEADNILSTPVADPPSASMRPLDQLGHALWTRLSIEQKRRLLQILERMIAARSATPATEEDRKASPRSPTGGHADRRSLARAFPACFNRPKSKAPKRPLKVGIVADAVARGVIGEDGRLLTAKRIERAVTDYCRGTKYAAALAAGAVRIDLDGNPAGTVIPEHAARPSRQAKTAASEGKA